jgi:regulatory protein
MRTVTDLREKRGRVDRYEVMLDGEKVASLSAREISDLHLTVGLSVDTNLESLIVRAGARFSAYDRAVGMLARGPRSMFELRRRLMQKGEDKEAIRWAVNKLQSDGVATDDSFAVQFARSRLRKGSSRSIVLAGLLKAAVARDIAEKAIAQVVDEEGWDERNASNKAADRKIRSLAKLDAVVARRRLVSFLRRRGFGAADVKEALDRLKADQERIT